MLVRYEIMTKMIDEEDANRLGDMIWDFVENKLGHECAMEIIDGSTEECFSSFDIKETFLTVLTDALNLDMEENKNG